MSIQRQKYEIIVSKHESEPLSAVSLHIHVAGTIQDRGDSLLMIGEAWCDAMRVAGFDPLKALTTIINHGKLH